MSQIGDRLAAIGRRDHLADPRLCELARPDPTLPAEPAEQAHLDACPRCRGLLVGYRRAEAVLSGAWIDRPLHSEAGGFAGSGRVGRVRVGRLRVVGPGGDRLARRWTVSVGAAAVLIGVVVGAGLLGLRGGGQPAVSGPLSAMPATPAGTGVVARLPIGQYATFSWSPDGAHLLVSDIETESRVYDRFGKLVSKFGPVEGWLDSGHLIGGDGYVADINTSHTGGPTANSWVVANGHGSAAIIVAVPACTGDPLVDWYRDGRYVRANEKVTPFGWSPDGRLILRGHLDCSGQDAELNGWKGPVDIVDFATGHVLATAPAVRGEMAFNPSATRLAAESDKDLEIVDVATGQVKTVPNARLLGWADDDYVYCLTTDGSVALVAATAKIPPFNGIVAGGWPIPSSNGPELVVDTAGAATRILGTDHKTTLLDLSSTSLIAESGLASSYRVSALRQSPWSPDGRMLALESSDGTSLALFSVDPKTSGSIAGALPTPIGSAQVIEALDRTALPGPVGELVSDPKRNAFWFLGGESGGPIELYRYDVATASLSKHAIEGTNYDGTRDQLAISPTGELWIGADDGLIVYDPGTGGQASLALPTSDPDVQVDPKLGKADPWIAGIAFDASGHALVARNWVRSLAQVDASLHVTGRVDVSDGFPMTGGLVVAGGRVYVLADPSSGLAFGVDATGTGKLSNVKFEASGLAAVGDMVLTAGTPPGWIDAQGGGAAMIDPAMASADLVAAGPDGVAVLYSKAAGEIQWRDKDGKVSAQGVFGAGAAPGIVTIGFDAQGRLWAVESAGGGYSLGRLSVGP